MGVYKTLQGFQVLPWSTSYRYFKTVLHSKNSTTCQMKKKYIKEIYKVLEYDHITVSANRHGVSQNQIIFSWKKAHTAAALITQISSLVMIWRPFQNLSPRCEVQVSQRVCSPCTFPLPLLFSSVCLKPSKPRTSLFWFAVVSFTLKLSSVEQDASFRSLGMDSQAMISCISIPEIKHQLQCELQRVRTIPGRCSWARKEPHLVF